MNAREKKTKSREPESFHVDETELQALTDRIAQQKMEEGDWEKLSFTFWKPGRDNP